MRFLVAVLFLLVATLVQAQQPSVLDQVDQALTVERSAANNALSIKDQRIAALGQERDALKKELEKAKAECKPKEAKEEMPK